MNTGKTKILVTLVLMVMLLAACTFAQAAATATAPEKSRIQLSAPDGLAYNAVYDASKHALHFQISAADSNLAAIKAYAENPQGEWGGRSNVMAINVALTPPKKAESVNTPTYIHASKKSNPNIIFAINLESIIITLVIMAPIKQYEL